MLIVPLEDAKSGMVLAAPVTHPDSPEQDLLRAGYVLEDAVIQRLREMHVDLIYVDYPALDDLDRHLGTFLSPARRTLYNQIKETITANQRRTRPVVAYTDYYSNMREMVTTLLSQGQHPIYLDQMSRLGADAIGHATAVAHLSLLLGIKLELYLIQQRKRLPAHHAKEVVNLGVAGMLHDMGKLKLPESLQEHTLVNPPEDKAQREEWEEHARLSYELVHGGVEPSAASAILHHHQRFDGTGFPTIRYRDGTVSSLEGSRIHVFARILAAADLYDRLSTGEKGARRSNLEILHLMRTQYASWVDPAVLDALQRVAPPFPPGSQVKLSDGTAAVVTDIDPAEPYLPKVKRMKEDGWTLDETVVALKDEGAPRIESINGVAVAAMVPQPIG